MTPKHQPKRAARDRSDREVVGWVVKLGGDYYTDGILGVPGPWQPSRVLARRFATKEDAKHKAEIVSMIRRGKARAVALTRRRPRTKLEQARHDVANGLGVPLEEFASDDDGLVARFWAFVRGIDEKEMRSAVAIRFARAEVARARAEQRAADAAIVEAFTFDGVGGAEMRRVVAEAVRGAAAIRAGQGSSDDDNRCFNGNHQRDKRGMCKVDGGRS